MSNKSMSASDFNMDSNLRNRSRWTSQLTWSIWHSTTVWGNLYLTTCLCLKSSDLFTSFSNNWNIQMWLLLHCVCGLYLFHVQVNNYSINSVLIQYFRAKSRYQWQRKLGKLWLKNYNTWIEIFVYVICYKN